MPDEISAMAGGTPWGAIAQGAIGIAQTIAGGIQAHRAQKKLEKLQSPTYTPNQSIMDYYNKALQRYNVNPYQSQQYQYASQMGNRNFAAGVNSLQSRNSAVGGISRLSAINNDAALKAGVAAEGEQNRRFSALGSATEAKAGEDRMAYQYNQLAPYEKKYNLLAQKAGGGSQVANAGISNTFGALQNYSNMQMLGKAYSEGGGQTAQAMGGAYSPNYNEARRSGSITFGNH